MLHGIFAVYDGAAKSYSLPFFADTTEVAVRMFSVPVNREGHQYNLHRDDFTLFHLGEFADEDGELLSLDTPTRVIGAWEIFQAPLPASNEPQKLEEALKQMAEGN